MSLRRFHPHGVQHTFNRSDQLPPATGTLRLYVDGTAGNDAASGQGGWANAWQTMARAIRGVSTLLFEEPTALSLSVWVRGAFAPEDLRLSAFLQGLSSVLFVHPIADHTLIQSGTLTANAAATEKHGIRRLTLGGGIVLTAADVGRTLLLTDGANIGTSMIIRVDAVNNYCWTTKYTYPAWVPAGGGITARIYSSSVSGIGTLAPARLGSTDFDASAPRSPLAFVGLNVNELRLYAGAAYFHGSVLGAVSYPVDVSYAARLHYPSEANMQPDVLAELAAAGYTAGATGYFGGGYNIPNATLSGVNCGMGAYCAFSGYSNVNLQSADGFLYVSVANIGGGELDGQHFWLSRVMSRGQLNSYSHGGTFYLDRVTWQDLPAAGIPDGLLWVQGGSVVNTTNVEGENTGTGARLYGFHFSPTIYGARSVGALILPDGIKGKHGRLRVVGADVVVTAATTWAASEGSGSDGYVEIGSVRFMDNFTKSAVNSETSIQNGVDGQITAATRRFTSATAVFTAAHVGRSIKVSGSINPANNAVHLISAFVDANNVTLVAGPVYVNEGPGLTWGLVGTPAPILEVARGGRVSQASGKTFNVRKPEVDPDTAVQEWGNYGYGVNGAIYEHENAEVTLGTVVEAAGAAGATGLAAKIKNGSKLVHTGGAVLLGVAPLDLGGNAGAIAWPATPSTDLASAAPQMCMVIPNA